MEEKRHLSASRMDTLSACSWKYWARYHLKVPTLGNDGSSMGSICHYILDYIFKPKHKKYFDYLKSKKTYNGNKVLEKVIHYHAKKLGVMFDKNLDMIDRFIQVAINNNFFGPKNTIERHGEKEFDIEVKEKDINFKIRGFIDQTFIYGQKDNLNILISDFKSSKRKFEPTKFNIQSITYQLACKYLYPHIKNRQLNFIFLAFPDDPIQESQKVDDQSLEGFKYFLTSQQTIIDNFSEQDAYSNFAADQGFPTKEEGFCKKLQCGGKGEEGDLKKDGNPKYFCEYRFPKKFYVVINEKSKKIVKSAFNKKSLEAGPGECIVEKEYGGCPRFFPSNYQANNQQDSEEFPF